MAGHSNIDREFWEATRAVRERLQREAAELQRTQSDGCILKPATVSSRSSPAAPTSAATTPVDVGVAASFSVPSAQSKEEFGSWAVAPTHVGEDLVAGSRVRLSGLRANPDLNGAVGKLILFEEGRWRVRFDDDGLGEKLIQTKNLELASPSEEEEVEVEDVPDAPGPYDSPPAVGSTPSRSAAVVGHVRQFGPSVAFEPVDEAASKSRQEQSLPAQAFVVARPGGVYVRSRAGRDSEALATAAEGDTLFGVRETLDGWVKLDAAPGWVFKGGVGGAPPAIEPRGSRPLLAADEPSDQPGPWAFEVVGQPPVEVFSAPSRTSNCIGKRRRGERVWAEAQSYNGWVRLAHKSGWMLSSDPGGRGELLQCEYMRAVRDRRRERQAASSALMQAWAGSDVQLLQAAIVRARAVELDEDEIRMGEQRVEALLVSNSQLEKQCLAWRVDAFKVFGGQLQAAEQAEDALIQEQAMQAALRERLGRAVASSRDLEGLVGARSPGAPADGLEQELQTCAVACAAAGLHEEARQALRVIDQVFRPVDHGHRVASLEALSAAAASGDPQQIKAARDAAKRAGLTSKEIARACALHSKAP